MGDLSRVGSRPSTLALVVVFGGAAAVMIAVGAAAGAPPVGLGLPDPGALTRYGLPLVCVVADIAAVLTIGSLLLAAFLVPPQDTGYLDVPGYSAVRSSSRTALVWMVSAVLMAVFTVSEVVGRPVVGLVADPAVLVAVVPQISSSTGWLVTGGVAAVVAIGGVAALTWSWALALLLVSLFGLLPIATSGHSAGSGSHDLAIDSLQLHLVGAALWIGGLVALLALAVRPATRPWLPGALPKFSVLAGWCWALIAVSGVVNLLVRIPVGAIWDSTYGLLAVAKIGALLALGLIGYLHRRRSVTAAAAEGGRLALVRLGGVEVLIMLATVGIAVGLGRTPPPFERPGAPPSRSGEVLGYDLAGPPDLTRLLLDWRPDLVMGVIVTVLLVGYLAAVRRLRHRGGTWPMTRVASWIAGCVIILVATSSGIGRYAAAMFSVQTGELVLLALVAPLFLAGGAPAALASSTGDATVPGTLLWVLERPAVRTWCRPLIAIGLLAAAEVLILGLGLIDVLLLTQPGRLMLELVALALGSLMVASVLTGARRHGWRTTGILTGLLVVHIGVAAALFVRPVPIAEPLYRILDLPWMPDLLDVQRQGAVVWSLGAIPIAVLIALAVTRSSRPDSERSAARAASAGAR